jgi:hypothetical protein
MRYLVVLEVSQKQAYIFASTKLSENIINSEAICKVTDPYYFVELNKEGKVEFDITRNLVYTGGGHTVLEFESKEKAKSFVYGMSKAVRSEYHEIELFAKIMPYDESATPGENLKLLFGELEKKKSIRQASFHRGTFGIEKLETNLRKPVAKVEPPTQTNWNRPEDYTPSGFKPVYKFDDFWNGKNDSSFIAIVHIDGNAMGKRVEKLRSEYGKKSWEEYKKVLNNFSDSIDKDFKASFKEMSDVIATKLNSGKLDSLNLKKGVFPIRKIILAGDDVCFVTVGGLGIEAARIFINKLSLKVNSQDHEKYTACAGVAIVHQKYPFYKAYEISEMLCSSAKKYLASFQDKVENAGGRGNAIDWHIEYGEAMENLGEIRKMYDTKDGKRLELRPYLISADGELMECEQIRRYDNFKKTMEILKRDTQTGKIPRGKLKELRNALKEGEQSSEYFMKSNLIYDLALIDNEGKKIDTDKIASGKGLDRKIFVRTADGKERSLLFDGIEIMDTYISLD